MGADQAIERWSQLAEQRLIDFIDWLGIHPSPQDFVKAILLVAFVLLILMVLGDVYRGEIQNTFHRIRLIGNPTNDASYKGAMQLPKYMVSPTLDGVYSNALFYLRYRDFRGRVKTKSLLSYRVKLRVRSAFQNASAPGQEGRHHYTEDEKIHLAKERPDLEAGNRPVSEIVAIARSRADFAKEMVAKRMAREDQLWANLETSWVWRVLCGVKRDALIEEIGLVVKFHFPINPYFLLYRHPDTNIRSTAWLTVLTSVFALFMQIVFASGEGAMNVKKRPSIAELASLAVPRVSDQELKAISEAPPRSGATLGGRSELENK